MEGEVRLPARDDVVALLSSLVAIDSVNPSLVPGAAGEGQIASFIASWLEAAGIPTSLQEVAPGRSNVLARVAGRGGGRSLLLNAHVDTVGTTGMQTPFAPAVDGDRLYGRGAYDMKAGLAAIMLAAKLVREAGGAAGDLVLTCVADEEYASLGTQAALENVRADAAIVTEPTGQRLCTAHKGFAWLQVVTHGRAAHGSKPELGIDAIAHMGRVLRAIEALQAELSGRPAHPLLGTPSIHASLIDGGQELSSYPDRCRLQIERRTVPGERPEHVEREVRAHLDALHEADASFSADLELFFWRDPFEVDPAESIVRTLGGVCADLTGDLPGIYGDTPWMDAAFLQAAGIPTVVFGPGGAGAHATVEYASISETARCAQILAATTLAFCS
jgi:acetylornithine deacetylase